MCKYRTYQNERTEFTEHKISPDILYHVAAIFTRLMLYDYDMPRSIWWWFYMRIHRTYLQDSNHCLKIATATAHCIRIIITMAKTPITASEPLHKCSSFFLCCCWCWSWCRCCRCCCYCSFLPVQTWFNRIHDTSIYLSIISYICCILLLALSDGDCVSVLYWTIRNSIKCICSRSASFSVSLLIIRPFYLSLVLFYPASVYVRAVLSVVYSPVLLALWVSLRVSNMCIWIVCRMQKPASFHTDDARIKWWGSPNVERNILQKVILCVTFIIGHGRSCLKSIPPLSLSMRWRWRWRLQRRWQQRRRWRRWKIHTSHGDLYTCKIWNV